MLLASATDDAVQAIQDAIASGDHVMLIAGGVALAAVVVVKALGKNIPLLDPLLQAGLAAAKKLRKKPEPPPAPALKVLSDAVKDEDQGRE